MLSVSIVVSVLLLSLAVASYLREMRSFRIEPGAPLRGIFAMLALRVGVTALLFLILSGITIRHHWTRPGRTLAVLVDVSLSMELVGADSTAGNALATLGSGLDIHTELFMFAETTAAVGSEAVINRQSHGVSGEKTLIASALGVVARQQPGAILLMSDGRDNGLDNAANAAARTGIPVYTVGCGTRLLANLAVVDMQLPDEIYSGETTRVDVRLDWGGPGPASAVLELNGRSSMVQFDTAGTRTVSFRHYFPEPGFRRIAVSAESIPGEITAADNLLETVSYVQPGRTDVCYITDNPGPSSRFITRALARISRVSLVNNIGASPQGIGDFDAADVYVIDRIQAGPGWAGWSRISEAVDNGAGLLIINETGFDEGHPLARFVAGGAVEQRGPVQVKAWPGHPIGHLYRADGEPAASLMLDRLPPLEPAAVPVRQEIFEPWFGDATGDRLLGGSRSMGRGRILYFGWPVWRWGFTAGDIAGSPTVLDQVLKSAVRFLSTPGEGQFRLLPTRTAFMSGDPVELELSAIATDGRPLTGAAPDIRITARPDTGEARPATGSLPMVEQDGGRYAVSVAGLEAGQYEAVATAGDDSVTARFVIAARSREEILLGLDDRLLRDIAAVSGGRYFHSDSLPGPGFEFELASSSHGFEFMPRRSVWVYILLVLMVAVEWIMRRRKGMQ